MRDKILEILNKELDKDKGIYEKEKYSVLNSLADQILTLVLTELKGKLPEENNKKPRMTYPEIMIGDKAYQSGWNAYRQKIIKLFEELNN